MSGGAQHITGGVIGPQVSVDGHMAAFVGVDGYEIQDTGIKTSDVAALVAGGGSSFNENLILIGKTDLEDCEILYDEDGNLLLGVA